MPKGISVNIGLNAVDSHHYVDEDGKPWPGTLAACENDARDMAALADAQGFEVRGPLLTTAATTDAVTRALTKAADELRAGDMLFLTYSGHGGQVDNVNPEIDDEDDQLDETWCLYDRELIDDELFALFARFQAGVRVLVLSDSCHSGTVTRAAPQPVVDADAAPKNLPPNVALATEAAHRDMYAAVQRAVPVEGLTTMAATVVLISGCQDHQTSRDGRKNGAFTGALLQAWKDPNARKSLKRLWKTTAALIPASYDQEPNFSVYGFDASPAITL